VLGAHPPRRHAPLLLMADVRVGRGRGEPKGKPVSWLTTCTFSLHVFRILCLAIFFPSCFLCGCGTFRVPCESILARWSTVVYRRADVSCRQLTLIHSITFPYCPLLPLTAPYCPILYLTAPYCPSLSLTAHYCPSLSLTAPYCPYSQPDQALGLLAWPEMATRAGRGDLGPCRHSNQVIHS